MKRSLSLILVFLIFVTATSCGGSGESTATTSSPSDGVGSTYYIGFMASITGAASSLGEPERDAAVMIQKQLDEQGGITGPDGVVHPVKILIYDTEGNGDIAVTVARKLIESENAIVLLGPSTSPPCMALIPVVQEAKIPMISMASSSEIVKPISERQWIFKVAQSNEHTSPWQVQYAKAKGLTKIDNLYVNNAYGEDGAAAIRETARAEGIEIVLEETFEAADTDMTAQITKIKASDAQAVLVTAIPPAAAIFTKQYRELGVDLPLLHNSGIGMQSFIDLSGASNAEGVIFPIGKLVAADALPDSDPQKPVLQQFISDYAKYVKNPPSQFAAHAWDSLQIVLRVLETFPEGLSLEEQRQRMRDGIENTKGFVGVDGVFNFGPDDHVGLSTEDVVLVRIVDGKWVYFPQEEW
ncbi:MAG: ABC transporter substrate-binding protein [Chloroflexi bacterium]|nr:ABC transporter substrate-binding protein [Chloroflexota bacterium]